MTKETDFSVRVWTGETGGKERILPTHPPRKLARICLNRLFKIDQFLNFCRSSRRAEQ